MRGLGILLVFSSLALAAPVPLPRPILKQPREFIGCYRYEGGIDATINLYASGYYDCNWSGQFWWGTWYYDQDVNVIRIRETFSFDRPVSNFTVTVKTDMKGRVFVSWVRLHH